MKRARPVILALFALCASAILAAQADNPVTEKPVTEEPATDKPEAEKPAATNPYRPGDGLFSIQLGTNAPLFMQSMADGSVGPTNLYWGGSLSLRYMTFLTKGFALGGEGGASFNVDHTERRTLYAVPVTFEALWYPVRMPFEFPMGIGAGMALLNLGDYYRFDPIIKPEIGAYYRASPSWSFGLTLSYNWIIDIYDFQGTENNQFGNFLDIRLSALYRL